jgi:hypothetical protein
MNEFNKTLIALKIEQAKNKPCILCERIAGGAGVFVPDEEFAAKVGKPKNKLRLFVYPLCARCQKKKNFPELVEDILLADTLSRRNNIQN